MYPSSGKCIPSFAVSRVCLRLTLFAIALLCCGLNSTVTATLSGQIVMQGFLDIRLPPYLRRLVTRAIAIVPAAIVTIWYGSEGTAQLLILSFSLLSLQLPFAIVPLVMFTATTAKWERAGRAALADGARRDHRMHRDRAEPQAALRFSHWLATDA